MPIILPDRNKRSGGYVEDAQAYSAMSKKQYAEAPGLEDIRKEAAMMTAKFLIEAIKSGDQEGFVEAFRQMLEVCED